MRGLLIVCSIAAAEEILVNGIDTEVADADQTLTGSARRLKKSNKYEEAARAAMEYTNFKSPLADLVHKGSDLHELVRNEMGDKRPEGIVAAFTGRGDIEGHSLNDEVEQVNHRKPSKKLRNADIVGQQYSTIYHRDQTELAYDPWMLPLEANTFPIAPGFGRAFNVPETVASSSIRPEIIPQRISPIVTPLPYAQRLDWLTAPQSSRFRYTPSATEYLSPIARSELDLPYLDYVPVVHERLAFGAPYAREEAMSLSLPNELELPYGVLESSMGADYFSELPLSYGAEFLPTFESELIRTSPFGLEIANPAGAELIQTPWGTTELVSLPFATEFVEAPLIPSHLIKGGLWYPNTISDSIKYSRGFKNLPLREPSVALPEFPTLRDTLIDKFNAELLEE